MVMRSGVVGEGAGEVLAVVRAFLEEHPEVTVTEGGAELFDLREANYTVDEQGGRVTLHLWSEERNLVRRVLSARRKRGLLRLGVLRFGQREPVVMEMVAERGVRLPMGRERERRVFAEAVGRVLAREMPLWRVEGMRTAADLEHSFGPGYVRGLQVEGQRAWAVVAVRAGESAATVEGVLTIAILWMSLCRERSGGRRLVEGVRVVVPAGRGETTLARMAWMDRRVAAYELWEFDEGAGTLRRREVGDSGNVETRLGRAMDEAVAAGPEGRFAEAIPQVMALLPEEDEAAAEQVHETMRCYALPVGRRGVEMRLRSSAELAFLRHGMEFARIRSGYAGQGFARSLEVTVGSGAEETVLTERNAGALREMVRELFRRRELQAEAAERVAAQRDVLFRAEPERWLESLLREDVGAIDAALEARPVYVQVGAIAGAHDRGVVDLLAATKDGRLAVIEVKAEEDLQLAMQGLDYWIRVREHHLAHADAATGLGDLQRQGYFPDTRLKKEAPVLYLVAPALRIHPATERVLQHFDGAVRWRLVALDERWRERIRPVWRRSSTDRGALAVEGVR